MRGVITLTVFPFIPCTTEVTHITLIVTAIKGNNFLHNTCCTKSNTNTFSHSHFMLRIKMCSTVRQKIPIMKDTHIQVWLCKQTYVYIV